MSSKFEQRDSQFSLILNDSGANVFNSSRDILRKLMCHESWCVVFAAVIKHDKDKDELGDVKTKHYHVVLQLGARCRIGTLLSTIVEIFHCNENQVSIEKCSSLCSQTRYLIHLDDYDKEDYDANDIETNNRDLVQKYLKHVVGISDIDDLIVVVRQFKNILELMSALGIDTYKRYRIVIADIRRELGYQV